MGSKLLNVIKNGMYSNSLTLYRSEGGDSESFGTDSGLR